MSEHRFGDIEPDQADLEEAEQYAQIASATDAENLQAYIDLDELELDRELVAKGGFAEFVRQAWPHVEAAELVWEPHLGLMTAHYEAVSRGQCRELVVNVPPGTGKSTITNVLWPAWDWGPFGAGWRRWIATSYSQALTARDAQRLGNLVNSEWYQLRWGYLADLEDLTRRGLKPLCAVGRTKVRTSKNIAASHFFTTQGGSQFSTMFNGQVTGQHCHILRADDPTKPQEIQAGGAKAREHLERTIWRWENIFASRRADPATFARVCIMQRLHESDLAGHMIRGGACHLRLPIRYQKEKHCKTPFGEDWRKEEGELLAPKRFPQSVIDELRAGTSDTDGNTLRRGMTAGDFEAQYQQDPHPESGTLFKREFMQRRWDYLPAGITLVISVDAAFKDLDESDYCAAQVWGRHGSDFYVVDEISEQLDVLGVCDTIAILRNRWKQARTVLVEDKANGPAAVQILRSKVPGLFLVTPLGGKVARARAVLPYWQSGNVILPARAPWLSAFETEHVRFPKATYDDRVDAGTQAILYLEGDVNSDFRAAMQKVRGAYG